MKSLIYCLDGMVIGTRKARSQDDQCTRWKVRQKLGYKVTF